MAPTNKPSVTGASAPGPGVRPADGWPQLLGFPAGTETPRLQGPVLDLRVETHEDALALPLRVGGPAGHRLLGAVYDRGGRVVVDSERAKVNRAWAGNPSRTIAFQAPAPETRLRGRTFYAGHFRAAFGHVLLELVPRFWAGLDYGDFDHVLVHATRVGEQLRRPLDAYVATLLEALGVAPDRLVLVDRPTTVDELTVASAPFVLKHGADDRAALPFDRVAAALGADDATGGPAVYLSRSRLRDTRRRAGNEVEIEALVAQAGYRVVHPQELDLAEQVRLVRSAPAVAGCDGSALHLAMFARPGTHLLALDSRMVENQLLVDRLRHLDAVHVYAGVGPPVERDDLWSADLASVASVLEQHGRGRARGH